MLDIARKTSPRMASSVASFATAATFVSVLAAAATLVACKPPQDGGPKAASDEAAAAATIDVPAPSSSSLASATLTPEDAHAHDAPGIAHADSTDGARAVPGDGGSPGDACGTDSDCRAFSDYCTGCDCRPRLASAKAPACSGPGVRCLVDPCKGKSAACVKGRCELKGPRATM